MKRYIITLILLITCTFTLTGCRNQTTDSGFKENVEIAWDDVKDDFDQIDQDVENDTSKQDVKALTQTILDGYDKIKEGITQDNQEEAKKVYEAASRLEYIEKNTDQKLSSEEKEILDEAKAIEQEAYNQLRGEAEIDAKHQLDKELAEISSKASIEASAQLEERLKKLVEKREEYVNTIFTEVKNKLVEFVNSSNYLEYLTSHVKAVSDEYQMTDCVLCVRKEDLKYADDLKKAYTLPIEVEEGQQIQLGGFIIENKTTNVVVDESLDSNLEAQKDWFYKTSGLMIK